MTKIDETAPAEIVAVAVAVVPIPTPTSGGATTEIVGIEVYPLPPDAIVYPVIVPAVETVAVIAAATGSAEPLTIKPLKSLAES